MRFSTFKSTTKKTLSYSTAFSMMMYTACAHQGNQYSNSPLLIDLQENPSYLLLSHTPSQKPTQPNLSYLSKMSLLIKPPKEDHIPHLPAYYHIFRPLQLILAIIILALTSYALTNTSSGYSAFAMFTAVATLVLLVYSAVTLVFYTVLYNRIAVLVADCLAIVAWLAAFASLATWASDISQLDDIHCKGDETCLSSNTRNSHLTATAVAASLGVLEL